MSERTTFPVGTRVRKREGWPTCAGEVISPLDGVSHVFVRWDGGVVNFYEAGELERVAPPEPPCRRLGHDFAQQLDGFGAVTTWLYCRRCGKQHRLGTVAER